MLSGKICWGPIDDRGFMLMVLLCTLFSRQLVGLSLQGHT